MTSGVHVPVMFKGPRPTLTVRPVNVEEKWAELKEAMEKVLTNPLDPPQYEIHGYASIVYRLCTAPGVPSDAGNAAKLHDKLKAFLIDCIGTTMLPAVKESVQGPEGVPTAYLKKWETYRLGMEYINSMFHYFNQNPSSSQSKASVKTLGYTCWKDHLYNVVKKDLITALLGLIDADRKGQDVDHSLLQGVIQSIVALGVDKPVPTDFYSEEFEKKFLGATEMFYEREVAEKLSVSGDPKTLLPEYMIHIERRLDEEGRRLQRYLDRSTEKGLERTLIRVTIDNHIERLLDACVEWFEEDRAGELKRLFKLMERSDGGLEPLRKIVEDRIDNEGKQAILKVKNEALKDPCVYVETILKVHRNYTLMVNDIFQGHPYFIEALDIGCKRFINKNTIAASSGARSAELLAKYTHMLLKPSSKLSKMRTDAELEETLKDVLIIFSLLQDTDVFQRVYRDKLSHRLIQSTFSQDQETLMIEKLKKVCGYEYTYKLQRMFLDIGLSAELTSSYDAYCALQKESGLAYPRSCDEDTESQRTQGAGERLLAYVKGNCPTLHLNILTSVSWPQTAQKSTFVVPEVIQLGLDNFTQYYKTKHRGRSLLWLHPQSNGILRSLYTKMRSYEFQVSTHQAAVLLAFDDCSVKEKTAGALLTETKMSQKELDAALHILTRGKLLTSDPPGGGAAKDTRYQVNEDFQSNLRKIQLFNAVHKETQQAEDAATLKFVAEDRKYAIQVCPTPRVP